MKEIFSESEYVDDSLVYNKSNREFFTNNDELKAIVKDIELLNPQYTTDFKNNLTTEERQAINKILKNDNIILKTPDKGSGWVIMDKSFYKNKLILNGHLDNDVYMKIDKKSDQIVFRKMKELVTKHKPNLTNKEFKYLTNFKFKSSLFYCNPKIHKSKIIQTAISKAETEYLEIFQPNDLTGRPIVAGPESPTQRLSGLLEILLKPIVPCLTTYIKDDWDFIRFLPSKIDFDCTLYSCDIVSLYTSIPTDVGLNAISYWINKKRNLIPSRFSTDFILEALEFVLKNNNFYFDDQIYNQIEGTAMGTKCAPPYACLTIGHQEETKLFNIELPKYFTNEEIILIKKIFKRYMDDGILIWPNYLNFEHFQQCLHNLQPNIKFTFEKAKFVTEENGETLQILNFLDITIIYHCNTRTFETDIYYKDTNAHDYLSYLSAHPEHTKENVPYNLAKRIIVFVSDENKIKKRLDELKIWLRNCNYPDNIINKAFHNAKLQGPAPYKNKNNNIPFVSTFYPNIDNKSLVYNIRTKINSIRSDYLKNIFKEKEIILSQKQPKNLKSILTSAVFKNDLIMQQRPNGLYKCNNKRCKICTLYVNECTSFQCSNGIMWEIRSNITCRDVNIIYYLKCNMCNHKTTYIGKTIGDISVGFKSRMNQHISESRDGISTCKFPRHVYNCGLKNNCLKEPFFQINIMFKLNNKNRLESLEQLFQSKGYDTLNSP